MGNNTIAPSYVETVIGSFNTEYTPLNVNNWSLNDRLFVIGNGTETDSRSDALRMLKNGNTAIGNIDPTAKLDIDGQVRIRGGAPGAGKVLVSDADGLASWSDGPVGPTGPQGEDGLAGPAGATGPTGPSTLQAGYDGNRIITANAGAVQVAGNDGLLVSGTHGSGAVVELSGAGTRMFFNPRKSAFRAGAVNGTQWNDVNVGNYSVAIGFSTTASGAQSTAMGLSTTASGTNSTALGSGTTASGTTSTAIGAGTTASGVNSSAMGSGTTASGMTSTAMGWATAASGDASTASGLQTQAYSFAETAIGSNNTEYTPANTTIWNLNDRLFVIGNSNSSSSRSDALRMLKNGNTAIGNMNPTTKLDIDGQVRIRGGAPGAGKVLTSDANGLATWQTIAGSLPSGSSGNTLRHDGTGWVTNSNLHNNGTNVGIGTTSPTTKLHVTGGNWNLNTTDGDILIGSSTDKMKFSMATGGAGAGVARINSMSSGSSRSVRIGVDGNDVLNVFAENVGIGTTSPTQRLTVFNGTTTGTYTTTGWVHSSDARLKSNVVQLGGSLEQVLRLRGVSFNWANGAPGRQVGFIAQEVEKVFPEVVVVNEDGTYTMAYQNLVAPLVEAMRELNGKVEAMQGQQAVIEALMKRMDDLEKENARLRNGSK